MFTIDFMLAIILPMRTIYNYINTDYCGYTRLYFYFSHSIKY